MKLPQRSQRARRGCDFALRISDCGLRPRNLLGGLCVLCGILYSSSAGADAAPQDVVPVTGPAFSGELVSINANGHAAFRVGGAKDKKSEQRTLALDEIVRWGNPVAPRRQTIVVLADGGRLIAAADWAGGATMRMDGGDVVVASDTWGGMKLPRGLVSGIVFAPQRRAEDRLRLVEQVREPSPSASLQGRGRSADVVMLSNGDRLTGKVTALDKGELSIETLGSTAKLPVARMEAIVFGGSRHNEPESETSPDPALKTSGKWAVGTRDGSLVYVKSIRADEKSVDVELSNGPKLKGSGIDDVVSIQSLGGAVVYLSDLEGADYRGVPYLSVKWPFTRDRNVLGAPIEVRGNRYLKGIGMHSAARLTYKLDGDYRRFESTIAIDDSAKERGSVTFGVYVLRDAKWSEAFTSGILRGRDAPQPISIDLTGAKGLTLTVDFADRGDELDHAVWLDARLMR